MSKNVKLKKLDFKDERKVLDLIYSDELLRETFQGERNTQSRLANSCYTALIEANDETVGFIMLINNPRTNMNEVDIGILKEHRRKGYAIESLKLLKRIIVENGLDVVIQTKKDNIGANKSVEHNGFTLTSQDEEHNYYSL